MLAYSTPPPGSPLPPVIGIPRANLMKYPGRGAGPLGPRFERWGVDLAPPCHSPDTAGSCPNCFSHDDPNDPARAAGPGPNAWWNNSSCRNPEFHLPNLGEGSSISVPQLHQRSTLLDQLETQRQAPGDGRSFAAWDVQRGLLDETLIVMCGEMGRTPRISPISVGGRNASGEIFTPGRHHWGDVFPCFFAGGGIRAGQVIGQTDRQGGVPVSTAYTPEDLAATIFHLLGI